MAEVIEVMDIDDDNGNINSAKHNLKGKSVLDSAAPPDARATPWVEKYRPQSLDDVAAHRDIVETTRELLMLTGKLCCRLASKLRESLPERLKHVIESEGLDVPENGMTALVKLSNGDMRKALNILQSTHMACQLITEEAVYLCTGNPLPKDIEQISHWLLNEPFTVSSKRISDMKTRKGLALVDIVREVTMFVFKIKMPPAVRVQLIDDMADIEYRLSMACNDKLQLGSLIAAFTRARGSIVAATK
ncbi:hypothetical protein SASPL_104183 [Salvia splendens]|uniref:Replication factor C C-terminal domain-containing protein n=1 Tax=Salvia splendens TaxID=180675 RepID=A0A8X9A7G9_SALSN|nr:hypothetical protein SASPL_104183 [Salvia splendens]